MGSQPRPRLTREGRRAAGVALWLAWCVAAGARYLDGAALQAAGLVVLGAVTAVLFVRWGDRRSREREGVEWTPGAGESASGDGGTGEE